MYHLIDCMMLGIPNFMRIGPYLRKCMDDAKWSGEEVIN